MHPRCRSEPLGEHPAGLVDLGPVQCEVRGLPAGDHPRRRSSRRVILVPKKLLPYPTSAHIVAQDRGELDTAQDWYRKSLAISEELGDRRGMALTYAQSGLLAEQQGQLAEALAWVVRCVSLFDEIPHPSAGSGPRDLARLTSQLGTAALEDAWQAVTGGELPKAVQDYVMGRIQATGELSGQ
jgi:tetratricopeptide (TPR) repeat protein